MIKNILNQPITLPLDVYFGVKVIKTLSTTFKKDMYCFAKITSDRNDFIIKTANYEHEQEFGFAYISNLRFIAEL